MKKILRWLFNRYRSTFEDFFISDIFGDIPSDLMENSLKFLLSGGTSFDRWMRISAYSFQRKLAQPIKEGSGTIVGGLIFLKTLMIMMGRLAVGKKLAPLETPEVSPPQTIEDAMRGVDEFFENKIPSKVD